MDIFRQILRGVEYIHEQGLIHRDLKVHDYLFWRHILACTKCYEHKLRDTVSSVAVLFLKVLTDMV